MVWGKVGRADEWTKGEYEGSRVRGVGKENRQKNGAICPVLFSVHTHSANTMQKYALISV